MYFLVFFVGWMFVCISVIFWLRQRHYKNNGKLIQGRVIGIEKYDSESRRDGVESTETFLRPIIQYQFSGKSYYFVGAGSHDGQYKINRNVMMYQTGEGPEFVALVDGPFALFSKIFFLVGIGVVGGFLIGTKDVIGFLIGTALASVTLFVGYNKLEKSGFLNLVKSGLLVANIESDLEAFSGRNVMWDSRQLKKEMNKQHKLGVILSGVMGLVFAGVLNLFFEKMPEKTREILLACLNGGGECFGHSNRVMTDFFIAGTLVFMVLILILAFFGNLRKLSS